MSTIHEQLRSVFEQTETLRKIKTHLSNLQEQIRQEKITLSKLSKRVDHEHAEFEKLDQLSLKSIFHSILGDKEQQSEKGRQEYLQAYLRYNDAKKSLELLEFEFQTLSKKLEKESFLQVELERLIKAREQEMLVLDEKYAIHLQKLFKEGDKLQKLKIEINEAIKTGDTSLVNLTHMITFLNQARQWGHTQGKGPAFLRRGSIDKARTISYQVKLDLQKFSDELRDVYGESYEFPFQMESFSGFLDMFYDNLISDWIIQNKIKNSLNNCLAVRDRVHRFLSTLKGELPELEKELASLEQKRKDFILTVK